MNSSQEPNETMIRYLDGELTGTELNAFNEKLANDPALKSELENLIIAKLAIQHYGLKEQVASVHGAMMSAFKAEEIKTSKGGVYPFVRTMMRVAAVLFFLLVVFDTYELTTVTPSKLGKAYYLPYDLGVERGENSKKESEVEKAYGNHDYKGVLLELTKEQNPTIKDRFLSGQSYLATGQAAGAIKEFNAVLKADLLSDNYHDDAEYYLGISYLYNQEPLKAKAIFDKIYADDNHIYNSRVTWLTQLKLKLLVLKKSWK